MTSYNPNVLNPPKISKNNLKQKENKETMVYNQVMGFTSLSLTEIFNYRKWKMISYNFYSQIIVDSEEVAK